MFLYTQKPESPDGEGAQLWKYQREIFPSDKRRIWRASSLQVLRLPSPIGDSSSGHGHERSPLAAFPSMGRVAAGQTMEKRPQPTEEPAGASILAEGSLNDSRREAAHTFKGRRSSRQQPEKPTYFCIWTYALQVLKLPSPIGDSSRPQPRKKPSGGFPLDG